VDNNQYAKDSVFKTVTGNGLKTTQDSDNWFHITVMLKYGIGDNTKEISDFIKTCDACGWYLADCIYYDINDTETELKVTKAPEFQNQELLKTPTKLDFRAKFNKEYKQTSLPRFLYHVTPTRLVDKIIRQGLTPRNNGRIAHHPERVYCFWIIRIILKKL
jgi:hypothetical protein